MTDATRLRLAYLACSAVCLVGAVVARDVTWLAIVLVVVGFLYGAAAG